MSEMWRTAAVHGRVGFGSELDEICAGDELCAPFRPGEEALVGGQSIDVALDVEHEIDVFYGLDAIGEVGGAVFRRRCRRARRTCAWQGCSRVLP